VGRTDGLVRRGHPCGAKLEKLNATAHRLDQTPAGAAAKTRSASRIGGLVMISERPAKLRTGPCRATLLQSGLFMDVRPGSAAARSGRSRPGQPRKKAGRSALTSPWIVAVKFRLSGLVPLAEGPGDVSHERW